MRIWHHGINPGGFISPFQGRSRKARTHTSVSCSPSFAQLFEIVSKTFWRFGKLMNPLSRRFLSSAACFRRWPGIPTGNRRAVLAIFLHGSISDGAGRVGEAKTAEGMTDWWTKKEIFRKGKLMTSKVAAMMKSRNKMDNPATMVPPPSTTGSYFTVPPPGVPQSYENTRSFVIACHRTSLFILSAPNLIAYSKPTKVKIHFGYAFMHEQNRIDLDGHPLG